MWRFIVVTFAFLAFAFYQMSGGADYSPREGSRQHAAMTQGTPTPKDTDRTTTARAAANPAQAVQGAQVVLASAGDQGRAPVVAGTEKRVRLTVGGETAGASAATTAGVATVAANPEKIARLLEAASMTTEPNSDPEPTQISAAVATAQSGPDIRKVISQRVNLREGPGTNYGVAGKLTRGMEVEITGGNGDGWVELEVLETGQTGWMADFLLSPKS